MSPHDGHRGPRAPLGLSTLTLAGLAALALVGWLILAVTGPKKQDSDTASGGTASAADSTPPATPAPATTPGDTHRPSPTGTAPGGGDRPSDGPRRGSLAGRVVVVDPGHNPNNHLHTAEINRSVDVGNAHKECDTTGTATNAGYAEATFTLDVARRLRTLLEKEGAEVVLTHNGKRPWGPCVDERAEIGNTRHADAAVSVHADGAPAARHGFHVIAPAPVHAGDADTRAITTPSRELGYRIVGRFTRVTGTGPADYVGDGTGLDVRDDLGGLNLSKVPKVFVECGNMRNSGDAARLTNGAWRQKAAQGIFEGIEGFLNE